MNWPRQIFCGLCSIAREQFAIQLLWLYWHGCWSLVYFVSGAFLHERHTWLSVSLSLHAWSFSILWILSFLQLILDQHLALSTGFYLVYLVSETIYLSLPYVDLCAEGLPSAPHVCSPVTLWNLNKVLFVPEISLCEPIRDIPLSLCTRWCFS